MGATCHKLETRTQSWSLVLTLSLMACSGDGGPSSVAEEGIPSPEGMRLERMFTVFVEGQAPSKRGLFGGFDGAVTSSQSVRLEDGAGQILGRAVGDAHGRLELRFDPPPENVVYLAIDSPEPERIPFRIRDAARAREAAVASAVGGAGSVPNDLVIVGGPGQARGVLVRSGDNAVSIFDLERGLNSGVLGIRLPTTEDGRVSAHPWFVAPLEDEALKVFVTAWNQRRVYLLDLINQKVDATIELDDEVVLDEPFVLPRPVDVDGDGQDETSVTRFVPSTPQAAVVHAGRLVVTWTSVLLAAAESSPVYLPGVVALWDLADLNAPPVLRVLPALNPQEVRPFDDHRVLVVSTGRLDGSVSPVRVRSPGAVHVIDLRDDRVVDTFLFPDFGPGTAMVQAGGLWVGSLVKGVLRRIDLAYRQDVQDFRFEQLSCR